MKKARIIIAAVILVSLSLGTTACTDFVDPSAGTPAAPSVSDQQLQVPESPPPYTPMPLMQGYSLYENSAHRLSVQYPSEWLVNDNFNDETLVAFMDFSDFAKFQYINIVVLDAEGIIPGNLMFTPLDEFTAGIEQELVGHFDGFESISAAEGVFYGSNYFLCFKYKIFIDEDELALYGALTVNNEKFYRIEFSTEYENLADSIETYNNMLSSLFFSLE